MSTGRLVSSFCFWHSRTFWSWWRYDLIHNTSWMSKLLLLLLQLLFELRSFTLEEEDECRMFWGCSIVEQSVVVAAVDFVWSCRTFSSVVFCFCHTAATVDLGIEEELTLPPTDGADTLFGDAIKVILFLSKSSSFAAVVFEEVLKPSSKSPSSTFSRVFNLHLILKL